MPTHRRSASVAPKAKDAPSKPVLPRELKTALWFILPAGAAAVLIVLWPALFPVPPEQLVEVVWKHECTCAHGWMESLRAKGYTVRDYELEDTRTMRQRWRVPDNIRGCHPASYLGYFLDGHISADTLHRLARERPQAIGVQQIDTIKPDDHGIPKVVSSQVFLISHTGAATTWSPEEFGDAPR